VALAIPFAFPFRSVNFLREGLSVLAVYYDWLTRAAETLILSFFFLAITQDFTYLKCDVKVLEKPESINDSTPFRLENPYPYRDITGTLTGPYRDLIGTFYG
jgi:hypothetical protein